MPSLSRVNNRRILIVDDNPAIHEDYRKILCPSTALNGAQDLSAEAAALFGDAPLPLIAPIATAFEVDSAFQGQDGLKQVVQARSDKRPYALAFVDVRMPPGWDGLETTVKLWETDPDLQVVICTAYSDRSWEEMMEKVHQPERMLILKKPFDTIEVLQLAHALTEKWALLQASRLNWHEMERVVAQRTNALQLAGQELQTSEQRFRKLSMSAPIGIFEMDAAGRAIYANPQWEKISGLSASESMGEGWKRAVHPDDLTKASAFWRTAVAAAKEGRESESELKFARPDGDVRWVSSRVSAIRSESGEVTGYVGSLEDITERKKIEIDVARARDAALESVRIKTRFLANITHELRTPLIGINGLASLMAEDDLPSQVREHAQIILQCGESLLDTIQVILTQSSLEAGKCELATEPFRLSETVEKSLRNVEDRARRKGLALEFRNQPGMPEQFIGDPLRLQQVLTHLLSNAVKFTEKGGIVLRSRARRLADARWEIRISIFDTGIGIARQNLGRLFKPFSQLDDSSTRSYEGMGLGLTVAKSLVNLMDGEITVRSKLGRGSVFSFSIVVSAAGRGTISGPTTS